MFLLRPAATLLAALATVTQVQPAPMVEIPGATFEMGTDRNDIPRLRALFEIRRDDLFLPETPPHRVTIDAFRLDAHEVPNHAFAMFLDRHPEWKPDRIDPGLHNGRYLAHWKDGRFPPGDADHPVVNLSWFAAVAFCRSIGRRLPTEAEWEWAARGGRTSRMFPWGDDPPDPTRANYAASGLQRPASVGSYPPNGYGLFDMAGNVWEYAADEWAPYPASPQVNPLPGGDPYTGDRFRLVKTRRVIRGGSWGGAPVNLRVTYRDSHPPEGAGDHVGFRCAESRSSMPAAGRR